MADNQTWHVDDRGRSCVLWLDLRSDDRDRANKSEVEEEVLKLGRQQCTYRSLLKVVSSVTYSLMKILQSFLNTFYENVIDPHSYIHKLSSCKVRPEKNALVKTNEFFFTITTMINHVFISFFAVQIYA